MSEDCRGQLVGRQRELRELENALARLSRSRSGWVALSGEPGVGKTRLLGELTDRADRSRHLVLSGRGAELEREMPFGVWVDALDDHVAAIGQERLERLVGDRVDELALVLPSVRASGRPQEATLQGERYRAHRAVRFLLERLAAQRPVVVALDDLHWADDASLELVAHLLRRPVRGAVLVALAFRAGQLPPWLAAPIEAARRDGLVSTIAVPPLSAPEADALLGSGVAAAVRTRLYELTGGNPFYLEQLARLEARALLDADDLATVPEAVAAALGQQVAGLSEDARLLAWGAAVAGDPFDLELAATTSGMGEDLATDVVDELLRAQLLAPTADPCRYRFRHPIVRRSVYEAAGETWRLQAHARAAAALAARRASAAARAHHLEHCARVGDEQAVAVFVEAGHEAAPRAPAGAARWFEAALRLLPQDLSALPRRMELLVPFATALVSAGRLEQGLDVMLDALARLPTFLGAIRVKLVVACARCENLLGRHDAAHTRLLGALAALDDEASLDGATLQAELAVDAIYDSDFEAALDWAQRAHATARAHGDVGLEAAAIAHICFINHWMGRVVPAELARAEAVAALDSMDDDALAGRLGAIWVLGMSEHLGDHFEDSIRHLQRGIAVSRASGQGQFVVAMMIALAHALEVRGRLHEAAAMAESAVEGARLAGNRQFTGWALVAEAWIAAWRGEPEQALRGAEEALTTIAGLDENSLSRATRVLAAAAFIKAGYAERGLRQAELAGAPDFPHVEPARRAWLCALMAEAELDRGCRDAAEDWLDRSERAALSLDLAHSTAATHTRALLLLEDGRPQDAADAVRCAIEHADRVGATLYGARARIVLGTALGRAGHREEAIEVLREAEATLAICGAQRLRDEAARELRRLGRRPSARQRRGAGGEGLDALSGREREVAELVARGHTNGRIAAQLFLSAKTVEGHLTNVFAKLRVRSRAEVAEAIGRARASPS